MENFWLYGTPNTEVFVNDGGTISVTQYPPVDEEQVVVLDPYMARRVAAELTRLAGEIEQQEAGNGHGTN